MTTTKNTTKNTTIVTAENKVMEDSGEVMRTVETIDEFYKECIRKNLPALVPGKNTFPSHLFKTKDGLIDHEALLERWGAFTVPVKRCTVGSRLDDDGRAEEG